MIMPIEPHPPMKLTIEPTPEIVAFKGDFVRVWKGTTEAGVPCTVYVRLIRVEVAQPQAEFGQLDPVDVFTDEIATGLM